MAGNAAAAASCAAGYLIGSVPFGLIVGKAVAGLDVRDFGSGNMGTANVLRTVGARAGAITFALDVAKGAAAVGLARRCGADPAAQAAAGLAACVGHSWPVFARFRGGKAVATAFGGLLMVSPEAAAWATVGGLGALAVSRTMSVGSLTAAGTATLGAGLESSRRHNAIPFVFTALASALVIVRHASNIRRIARGEEPQLSTRLWSSRH
ncbi:MAG TPA: glycerol-3-phosphate 1-O-acyltransferase PlsY [Candidatus Saccharimonadales bacterium]|nr:glycerol-3-phosphate 1-O-acyltransferase PlsY [Candidatus Saccharimonadales bacterium]